MNRSICAALALVAVVASTASAQRKADKHHAVRIKADPAMLREAHISADSARVIAVSQVKGGTITSGELKRDGTRLQYEVNLVAPKETGVHRVEIDAMTGAVLSTKMHGGPVGLLRRVQQKTSHSQAKADSTSRAKP